MSDDQRTKESSGNLHGEVFTEERISGFYTELAKIKNYLDFRHSINSKDLIDLGFKAWPTDEDTLPEDLMLDLWPEDAKKRDPKFQLYQNIKSSVRDIQSKLENLKNSREDLIGKRMEIFEIISTLKSECVKNLESLNKYLSGLKKIGVKEKKDESGASPVFCFKSALEGLIKTCDDIEKAEKQEADKQLSSHLKKAPTKISAFKIDEKQIKTKKEADSPLTVLKDSLKNEFNHILIFLSDFYEAYSALKLQETDEDITKKELKSYKKRFFTLMKYVDRLYKDIDATADVSEKEGWSRYREGVLRIIGMKGAADNLQHHFSNVLGNQNRVHNHLMALIKKIDKFYKFAQKTFNAYEKANQPKPQSSFFSRFFQLSPSSTASATSMTTSTVITSTASSTAAAVPSISTSSSESSTIPEQDIEIVDHDKALPQGSPQGSLNG